MVLRASVRIWGLSWFLTLLFCLGAGLLTVTKTVASWKSFQLWSSLAQTTCNQRPPMGTVVSCVCVSLHIGDSHNAFELPISDYTVHCAGPFWSPKLSHSVSAFALWVGLWFQYVSIRITHSTRLSNLQILELTMTMPAFVPRDFWPPSAHDCWTSPPHPSVASGDGNLSTFP